LSEGVMLNACQPLEILFVSVFDFFIFHVPIMAQFSLMQEVYSFLCHLYLRLVEKLLPK